MFRQKTALLLLTLLPLTFTLSQPASAAEVVPLPEGKTAPLPLEQRALTGSSDGLSPMAAPRPDFQPRGTSTDLSFTGPFSFAIANNLVDMAVGRVDNNSPAGSTSGTIELWLWASTSIPVFGGSISGHALTKWRPSTWQGTNGNQLMGGFQVSNIDLNNLPYTAPPANCYYISILLEEWNGSAFVYHDIWTYTAETFGLGGGSCVGPPSAPSGLAAVADSSSVIDLFWNDNSDNEDEFRVEVSSGGAFADIGSVSADSTGVRIVGLSPDTTYSFRIRAYSNADGYSSYSNTATATTFSDTDCVDDPNNGVVCLRSGRFELRGTWTDFSNPPITQPLIWTAREDINATAGFQNNPSGIQIVMRAAEACSLTGTYWLWLGGFTDAGWDITVRDTITGISRSWTRTRSSGNFPTTTRDTSTFSCN